MLTGILLAVSTLLTVTGFDAPESAAFDEASSNWFVSNVGGNETAKDGKGWISRLDLNGHIVEAHWLDGLNAPKGIRLNRRKLYVADIDELVLIDIWSTMIKARIKIPGAKFLNDVAVGPGGEVYVSDTLRNAIYRCTDDKKCDVFIQSNQLECPNGLLVEKSRLVVAAWGTITNPATFATKTPGRLLGVDLRTKKITPLGTGRPIGNLDGIESDGKGYLVTDWVAGKLLHVSSTGVVTVLRGGFKNSADIGYEPSRKIVLLPEMGAGRIQVIRIEP